MANALLLAAVDRNEPDMVARLLEEDDALVNCANGAGQTPLHIATSKSYFRLIQLLLSYGAKVDARTLDRYGGLCALHIAARYDSVEIGRELVRFGAPINGLSATASTPLIECAKFNSVNFATWLLSIPGIDAVAVDSSGFSAHYYAKKNGFTTLLKLVPSTKFDLWKQVEKEPRYNQNMAAVKETIEKKERLLQKKLEAAEKKKKKKLY